MTLAEIVEAMSKVNVLVIGDAIVDEYIFGRVDRVCPEAPVPCFIPERFEQRGGGAMNVVEQLRALGVHGKGLYNPAMSIKRRYMVGHQMLLRVDEDWSGSLDAASAIEALNKHIFGEEKLDAIVLSDYAKGVLTPELCQYVIKFANENGIPVVVDPKGSDWSKYAGATWLCPNEHEGFSNLNSWEGGTLRKQGAKGLHVVYSDGAQIHFDAQARHVFDVCGAGDVVVAVFTAMLAAGAGPSDAACVANLAAGWTVGEIGTTVCPKDTLLGLLK